MLQSIKEPYKKRGQNHQQAKGRQIRKFVSSNENRETDYAHSREDGYEEKRIEWALKVIENSTDGLVKFERIYSPDEADLEIYGVNTTQTLKSNLQCLKSLWSLKKKKQRNENS